MDAFSLGEYLRQARESQELTLKNAESTLRIRQFILEGFEQGNFHIADFSEVQIRGFLRNYARFLSLDDDLVIHYYESALAGNTRKRRGKARSQPEAPPPSQPRRPQEPSARPPSQPRRYDDEPRPRKGKGRSGRGAMRNVMLGLVALGALAVIAVGGLNMMDGLDLDDLLSSVFSNDATTLQAGDSQSGAGLVTLPTPTPTPEIVIVPTGTATLIPRATQVYAGEPLVVTLEFRQRAWAHVIADGEDVFRGLVRPNELVIEQRATNAITVITTNANALVVTYNGQPQPSYGGRGQAVTVTYRPDNDITVVGGSQVVAPRVADIDAQPVTATDDNGDSEATASLDVAAAQPEPTLTPDAPAPTLNPNLPTPLPLLGQPTRPPDLPTDTPPAPATSEPATGSAPASPQPVATDTPPPTATPDAVLPPRQTPANPTPTKIGG